jgi:hypothetical protein
MWPRVALGAALLLAGAGSLHAQNWNDWHRDNDRREDYNDHRDDWRDNNWREDQRDDHRDDDRRNQGDNVTETQKNACKPDVFRLCSWYIPSREKITACLNQNIGKLTPDCRAVMEGRLR